MRQRSWHRAAVGAAILVLPLLVPACGRTHVMPEGELEIQNGWSSPGTIVAIEVEEVVGPNFLAFDVHARPGDTVSIDVFPSLYDVWVLWVDGFMDVYTDIEIHEDCTTTLKVRR